MKDHFNRSYKPTWSESARTVPEANGDHRCSPLVMSMLVFRSLLSRPPPATPTAPPRPGAMDPPGRLQLRRLLKWPPKASRLVGVADLKSAAFLMSDGSFLLNVQVTWSSSVTGLVATPEMLEPHFLRLLNPDRSPPLRPA